MTPYSIRYINNKAKKEIEKWIQYEERKKKLESAINKILTYPYYDHENPSSIRHLKGKQRCSREYRFMQDNYRLIYQVEDKQKVIDIDYFGPRPWS